MYRLAFFDIILLLRKNDEFEALSPYLSSKILNS